MWRDIGSMVKDHEKSRWATEKDRTRERKRERVLKGGY